MSFFETAESGLRRAVVSPPTFQIARRRIIPSALKQSNKNFDFFLFAAYHRFWLLFLRISSFAPIIERARDLPQPL
jgi:hypothetical protein